MTFHSVVKFILGHVLAGSIIIFGTLLKSPSRAIFSRCPRRRGDRHSGGSDSRVSHIDIHRGRLRGRCFYRFVYYFDAVGMASLETAFSGLAADSGGSTSCMCGDVFNPRREGSRGCGDCDHYSFRIFWDLLGAHHFVRGRGGLSAREVSVSGVEVEFKLSVHSFPEAPFHDGCPLAFFGGKTECFFITQTVKVLVS
jgi:hypothetical protein